MAGRVPLPGDWAPATKPALEIRLAQQEGDSFRRRRLRTTWQVRSRGCGQATRTGQRLDVAGVTVSNKA